jgi:hypothetical protein
MKDNYSENLKATCDAKIIKHILTERLDNAVIKEKMYRILYEASMSDDVNMDTDLIDECIQTLDIIDGNESYLTEEEKLIFLQGLDEKYRHYRKMQRKGKIRKVVGQISACFLTIFIMSSVVANAFGYNLMQKMLSWGKETLNLLIREQSDVEAGHNISYKIVDSNVENILRDIEPKPLLPQWLPDGFIYQDSERVERQSNTNIILYYEDAKNRVIILDYVLYNSNRQIKEFAFEKDENKVEIYEKSNIKHYIFRNLDQVQVIWDDINGAYNIHGDISVEDMKKIINSIYGG